MKWFFGKIGAGLAVIALIGSGSGVGLVFSSLYEIPDKLSNFTGYLIPDYKTIVGSTMFVAGLSLGFYLWCGGDMIPKVYTPAIDEFYTSPIPNNPAGIADTVRALRLANSALHSRLAFINSQAQLISLRPYASNDLISGYKSINEEILIIVIVCSFLYIVYHVC